MKAVIYHHFGETIAFETVKDLSPAADGAVIRVEATGLCRSDWHGWRGHDPDIKTLPHVPGHEFAGTVVAIGDEVRPELVGQRVTMPFVAGCGNCRECRRGNPQICDRQFQPGFTGWGSFAEYVAVRYANGNLVSLPESMSSVAAASMGCRLGTAFRAVSAQGAVRPEQWVAIHGCGGFGLAAVMVASALGARVIAVDIRAEPLALAKRLGAAIVINVADTPDVAQAIHDHTNGGVDVSLDAVGSITTLVSSIFSLRKRGRHVQVGLLAGKEGLPPQVIGRLIAWELELAGSHGIAAHAYPLLFDLIQAGKLDPTLLVDRKLPLEAAPSELASLNEYRGCGITVFTPSA